LLVAGLCLLLLVPAAAPAGEPDAEPEEPDFFFLTGGPYTQKKHSPQIIWANQRFRDREGASRARSYTGAGRAEWGFTDRLEFDAEFGALSARETEPGAATVDADGADDVLFGIRYRLLREGRAPFTLTTGPQVIAPVASRREGLGTGRTGFAWDLAVAKDWGGPIFLAASANVSTRPGARANRDGTGPRLDVSGVEWGAALGWRALEHERAAGGHDDVHVLFELGGARGEDLEVGDRTHTTELFFSPGIRYGFLSRRGALAEIGVAFPVGLNRQSPDWGVILQIQFELPPVF
jgi:hypothetical protein